MMVTVPDGRAIPFCSYHLTDAAGRRVYAPVVQGGAEKSLSERIALHEGAMEVSDAVGMTDASAVSHQVRFDEDLCAGCGLCEAFCPMRGAWRPMEERRVRVAVRASRPAWGCSTCSGQCPQCTLIRIEATARGGARPL